MLGALAVEYCDPDIQHSLMKISRLAFLVVFMRQKSAMLTLSFDLLRVITSVINPNVTHSFIL